MPAPFVDTYELTRLGQQQQGQTPLREFTRLTADLPAQPHEDVSWVVRGVIDGAGRRFLDVSVKAAPLVECQRCMQTMPYAVNSTSRLLVVDTEAELDQEDDAEAAPDDWIEPILASRRLDVLALVEDELILALPYVPMHESCSTDALDKARSSGEDDEPSPFAVLSQLKKN